MRVCQLEVAAAAAAAVSVGMGFLPRLTDGGRIGLMMVFSDM